MFKIQPLPLGVDHMVHGAIGCWVDMATGALTSGRARSDFREWTTVPRTNRSFIGFVLPHWSEVKDLALRAAAAYPWARCVGWDIGIAADGPVLIEGNWDWSPSQIRIPLLMD